MNVNRIGEYLTTFVVLIVAFGIALYLGGISGQGNVRNVIIIISTFVVAVLGIKMKTNIWVFIPLTMGLTGSIGLLPLPFSVSELGILLAFGWFVIFQAFKLIRRKAVIGYLDILLFANLLILLLAFVRNPVGVSAIDADRVGGRPYFSTAIAVMGYWVLSHTILSVKAARMLPIFSLIGSGLASTLGLISYLVPSTVPVLGRIYSGITAETYLAKEMGTAVSITNRIGVLASIGVTGVSALCSWFRPITLINPLNIVRFFLFIAAIAMVFLSGFRSYLFQCAVFYLVASYYYGRMGDVLKNVILVFLGTSFLVVGQGTLFDLPLNAQRALTFLPGNWSQASIQEAQGSTEWRVEMWKVMWTEERWVKNWWIGDGFGYSSRTLEEMAIANNAKDDAFAGQENFLITGQVHSGPLSTLRYVGYIGLALYLTLCIAMAKAAHRLILRTKGTPFFVASLFFGISTIINPFFFVFVAGGYDVNFPKTVISLGFLKLLQKGFEEYTKEQNPEITVFPSKQTMDLRPSLLTR